MVIVEIDDEIYLVSLSWDRGCLGMTWGSGRRTGDAYRFRLSNTIVRERTCLCTT